ncbi:unnamed protein product [Phaedon cochleariae]|uniref:BTB domain-containing protein n=1 Tax=Phaedon cochleariae TaxID=80249 RepID=A0A9P0DK17_PHACE|nr:unnamed protein product [Phaedon cochleariae]
MARQKDSSTPEGPEWEVATVKGSRSEHWTGVDHLSGPLNPLCITDADHEILRPKPRRISDNSRTDITYHEAPKNTNNSKETQSAEPFKVNCSERMVSPKRKVEYFQHLYVANNVKTSTFSGHLDKKNHTHHDYKCPYSSSSMIPERDVGPNKVAPGNVRGSRMLRGQRGCHSEQHVREVSLNQHHHISADELKRDVRPPQCGHNSSDDSLSSGHASMSDTGHSSPRAISSTDPNKMSAGVLPKTQNSKSSPPNSRQRQRATPAGLHVPWSGNGDLQDIKLALQQLTVRSHTSTSTYSSISAGSESSEPPPRRLVRNSSLDTINTSVTNADEFVWVDSHNRLVELQHLPWTNHCILRVLQTGRCKPHMTRVNVEIIPRLSYLLQRALVRISREAQRLSSTVGVSTKHDITAAFRVVLCPRLADSSVKASLRASAMLAMSGDSGLKQSKSSRAGIQLHIGRFHRWMIDVNLAKFVHEYAAVYLCAGFENLLEEILLQCLPNDSEVKLTASSLEHAIANNGDLWGLLQPYAHLNAGRIASGVLSSSRWASVSSLSSRDSVQRSESLELALMTTCVGSLSELEDLIKRINPRIPVCSKAVRSLFYFMRCSQLEHEDQGGNVVQELCYERAYVVLPPLGEWMRVATAHSEHRFAAMIDKDDILQAARLLLPGVDCPVRCLGEEAVRVRKDTGNKDDQLEATKQIEIELAFRLMLSGRPEVINQAIRLLPNSTKLNTLNPQGHTALMLSAMSNDHITLMALIDAGASVDVETPSPTCPEFPAVNGENQHWTALTYAAAKGHLTCAKLLLDSGANVEGGASMDNDKYTLTPLQVACGSGNLDMLSLLCSHGANPFLSTQIYDTLSYSAAAQRGCFSPVSVAAAHGHRLAVRKLLAQPPKSATEEVLSLEEMLEESNAKGSPNQTNQSTAFTKAQIKSLQEAMYHSGENNHLDVTVEIRTLGVPWTLHCWMHSLEAAHEARLDCVIDQLLQDFLQVCQDDYSAQFVEECLPLLFNIFRYSKKEGTTLLLADIFSTCFGWEPIKPIRNCLPTTPAGSRIDLKYVNNPELSDVTFRVEGRLFYAHKILLVTVSSRFKALLSSKMSEGGLPIVQINDIRYHIFQIVMQFLYQGGCQSLELAQEDILEVMAAANFFQLDSLLRYCERRCAEILALDNVVSMYIHAKVYNAGQLLEYCQAFLLQNMVALLTYDDTVKRLLFAKKLPNHDVLGGLLVTLQARINAKRAQGVGKMCQN